MATAAETRISVAEFDRAGCFRLDDGALTLAEGAGGLAAEAAACAGRIGGAGGVEGAARAATTSGSGGAAGAATASGTSGEGGMSLAGTLLRGTWLVGEREASGVLAGVAW